MDLWMIISANKARVLVQKMAGLYQKKAKSTANHHGLRTAPRLPWWRPTPHNCTACPKDLPGEKTWWIWRFPLCQWQTQQLKCGVCFLSIWIHLKIGGPWLIPIRISPYTWADSECGGGSPIALSTPRVGMCCSQFLLHAWQLAAMNGKCRQLLAHQNGNINAPYSSTTYIYIHICIYYILCMYISL